jgi:hypothetical protein
MWGRYERQAAGMVRVYETPRFHHDLMCEAAIEFVFMLRPVVVIAMGRASMGSSMAAGLRLGINVSSWDLLLRVTEFPAFNQSGP